MKPNGTKTKKVMLIEFKVLWLYILLWHGKQSQISNVELLTVMNWKQKERGHINRVYPYEFNGV